MYSCVYTWNVNWYFVFAEAIQRFILSAREKIASDGIGKDLEQFFEGDYCTCRGHWTEKQKRFKRAHIYSIFLPLPNFVGYKAMIVQNNLAPYKSVNNEFYIHFLFKQTKNVVINIKHVVLTQFMVSKYKVVSLWI